MPVQNRSNWNRLVELASTQIPLTSASAETIVLADTHPFGNINGPEGAANPIWP